MMLAVPAARAISATRHTGAGKLVSATRTYRLGALTYVDPSRGRGVLDLELGPGHLLLSGKDADQIAPTTWRLKIDLMRIIDQRPVVGTCDLSFTPDGRGYADLACRGSIGPDGEPFAVHWRGDGAPSRRIEPSRDQP